MSERVPVGFLNINKPLHLTSHDVVAAVRRRYRALTGAKKVGHAGTLDPLANGVLIICLGAATRLSEYMMADRKSYRARLTFGARTSTYDAAGDILSRNDASRITRSLIDAALPQFIGEIAQVPPMYSAIKQKGKKLYQLARQGKTVARPARDVTIHDIEVISWRNPVLELTIHCGAGTYIRSLAHDLGDALEVGAYLSGLTRLASGRFSLEDSVELTTILESDDWLRHIISPYDALRDYDRMTLTDVEIHSVRHGGFLRQRAGPSSDLVFAFDSAKQLVAVLEPRGEHWKPRKVFPLQS